MNCTNTLFFVFRQRQARARLLVQIEPDHNIGKINLRSRLFFFFPDLVEPNPPLFSLTTSRRRIAHERHQRGKKWRCLDTAARRLRGETTTDLGRGHRLRDAGLGREIGEVRRRVSATEAGTEEEEVPTDIAATTGMTGGEARASHHHPDPP